MLHRTWSGQLKIRKELKSLSEICETIETIDPTTPFNSKIQSKTPVNDLFPDLLVTTQSDKDKNSARDPYETQRRTSRSSSLCEATDFATPPQQHSVSNVNLHLRSRLSPDPDSFQLFQPTHSSAEPTCRTQRDLC